METDDVERFRVESATAGAATPAPSASATSKSSRRLPSSTGGAPLILLVESDPAVRHSTDMLLEAAGYRVEAVGSLEDALEAARVAGRIDLLVTGYVVGSRESGTRVLEALRAAQGGILKAVLLTGDASTVTCRLRPDPDLRICCKPARAQDLLTMIAELLEEAEVSGARGSVDEQAAALVVHDLRSSLSVISNVLKSCRAEALSASLPNAGEILARQITKSLRMADDLLTILCLDCAQPTLERRPVSLTRVIVEAAKDLEPEIRRREQSLSLDLPGDELRIRGDSLRLGQVVTNILENASKYSGRGGCIGLSTQRVGRSAEIRIRDNGIGIHPKDLPHIFEPYFRSRASRCGAQDGSGLGLALARRLVELHGGTIQAQSDGPGLGTALTVRLPALSEPSSGLDCLEQ